MRKITKQAVDAIVNNYCFSSGNTRVYYKQFGYAERWVMELHGKLIAEKVVHSNILKIYDGGWESATTKERLNGLLSRMAPDYRITQKNHEWFIVPTNYRDELIPWTGSAKFHAGQYKGNA